MICFQKNSVIALRIVALLMMKNTPQIVGQDDDVPPMPHGLGPCVPGADGESTYKDKIPIQKLPAIVGAKVSCLDNLASIYPCRNIDLESFLPTSSLTGTGQQQELNDIWGWTNPDTNVDYAIIGLYGGTSFVDLSDPSSPVLVGYLPTLTVSSSWRDIKTYNNHAYIVSEANGHGMQVFDLMQLTGLSSFTTFSETARYSDQGLGQAHNVFINEDSGIAYILGSENGATSDDCSKGGLHMVNISDPINPTFVGCFGNEGYTHDVQCVMYDGPDSDYTGNEICFASNEDYVAILDVTDKSNIQLIKRIEYANPGYTHQGWLTEDHAYFLIDDEGDEYETGIKTRTIIADVSDLDAPQSIGEYNADSNAIDHNLYIKGNYVYQANYRAGLRVLDLNSVANGNLEEIAYFDVYPDDDSNKFNGAWSNYPFFESGIVIVSGIEQGLFVVRVNFPTLAPSSSQIPSFSVLPTIKPSFIPSPLPTNSFVPSSLPTNTQSFAPSRMLSSLPTSNPSFIPSTSPTNEPTESSSPSILTPGPTNSVQPSSKPDPVVTVATPCSVEMKGIISIPDDAAELNALVSVIEESLLSSIKDDDVDVVVNSIGGIKVNKGGNASSSQRHAKFDMLEGLVILFDVLKTILCDDGCENALDSVSSVADDINDQLQESMTDGSFTSSLLANALDAGVSALENVSVDSASFSSEEPIVEVVSATPTSAPSSSPSCLLGIVIGDFQHLFSLILSFLSLGMVDATPGWTK